MPEARYPGSTAKPMLDEEKSSYDEYVVYAAVTAAILTFLLALAEFSQETVKTVLVDVSSSVSAGQAAFPWAVFSISMPFLILIAGLVAVFRSLRKLENEIETLQRRTRMLERDAGDVEFVWKNIQKIEERLDYIEQIRFR
jgi:hypothetical protein